VMFTASDSLTRITDLIAERPDVDAVNFKIVFPDDRSIIPFNWFHPRDHRLYGDREFETDYISEGAVAFRKGVFEQVGYYPREFFLSHEGPDLAYRMIDGGHKIIYNPDIEVMHRVSRLQRPSWRNSYYDTRNQVWIGIRNLPWAMLVPHMVYRLFTTFCFSAARGHLRWYFKAIYDAVSGIPRELGCRKPVSRETVRRLREIRKHRLGPLSKAREFLGKISLVGRYYG